MYKRILYLFDDVIYLLQLPLSVSIYPKTIEDGLEFGEFNGPMVGMERTLVPVPEVDLIAFELLLLIRFLFACGTV
jgi:hypothetical protein